MENNLPEKFKNSDGTLNTESLLKSYTELEKKIGTMINVPNDETDSESREKFNRAIGVPENFSEYDDFPMFENIGNIKEKFFEIGLSKKQAAKIADMANEMLKPAIQNIINSKSESENLSKLKETFGTDLPNILKDIDSFANKKLDLGTYEFLASSFDGIMTIYNMMQAGEPGLKTNGRSNDNLSESDLKQMMKDPRYWKNQDPEFIRKIEIGFRKLFN